MDKLIEAFQGALDEIPADSEDSVPESQIQKALEAKLDELRIAWTRPRLPDPGGGYGQVDLLVPDLKLIIEIKRSGDWRCVAEASLGLFGYRFRLKLEHGELTPLAVFGSHLKQEYSDDYLEGQKIRYICRNRSPRI